MINILSIRILNGNLLPDKEVEYAHTHSVIRWATRLPPPAQRGKTTLSVSEGATVHDVLAQLGIRTPVIVNINETHEVEPSYPVREGDKLLVVGHSSVVDPAPLTFWQHFRTAYPAYADSVATAFGERPRWIKQLIEWWRFRSRWRWCAWASLCSRSSNQDGSVQRASEWLLKTCSGGVTAHGTQHPQQGHR
jgi:sulfur carrier protein ThiS